jgi:two-component system OmpR family sensor kinase
MRNSLLFKLLGAFILVISIGSLIIFFLVSRATQKAFSLYTTRSGQVWAQRLAPTLADYYATKGSWEGVDAFLKSSGLFETGMMSSAGPSPTPQSGGGYGNGQGQGRGMGFGRQLGMSGMMGNMMEQRLIVTDVRGVVVCDTQSELNGTQLPADQLEKGALVTVGNDLVGTVIVTPVNLTGSSTPTGQFLTSVNRSIVIAALIAGVIALLIGAVLFSQITAPLRQLNRAANAVAHGDLSQRVVIHSKDELGELGETFNQMAVNLAKAEIQRQHLTADVAHELRTPLAAIQASLEGMLDGVLPLDNDQITTIHAETLLLNRLIEDLRLLSLAEAGQLKLECRPIDLGELIRQVAEREKSLALQRGINLSVEIQDSLPMVTIDADRIVQVLNNLVGNALRYTPQGGVISIRCTAKTGATESVEVSVTDSGAGIPADVLPNVFDRFYRADKSRARASGGSGLGLAIVRQLVEAHGGSVEAESPVFDVGMPNAYGTRITFTLPLIAKI